MSFKAKIISIILAVFLFATALITGLCYTFNSRFKKNFNSWFGIENEVENSSGSVEDNSDLQVLLDLKNQELQEVLSENQELENKIDNLNFYISFEDKFSFDGSFKNYVTNENTDLTISKNKICVIDNSFFYFDSSKCYKLNLDSKIWENYTFNGTVPTQGSYIWTDGQDYYFSNNSKQTKLNRETNTWEDYLWEGFCPNYGHSVWSDGESVFYSSRNSTNDVITDINYKLNKETMTWEEIVFYGIEDFGLNGNYIWSDGCNIYFSKYSSTSNLQFKLNKETMTWEEISWNGLNPSADNIWTDGNFCYHSKGDTHFILDVESSTWFAFKSEYFEANRIFVLDNYVYCFTNYITYFYEIKAR